MSQSVKERKKGYCEVCKKEYANYSQHLNTQKHKRNAETIQEKENNEKINTSSSTGSNINDDESALNGNGIIYTEGESTDTGSRNRHTKEVSDMQNETDMSENNKTIAGIQIIDSETGKKQKGIVDEIFEKAFSPEFAPVTMSILDGLAKRLSGETMNQEQEEGQFVETVSGAKVWLKNKEF